MIHENVIDIALRQIKDQDLPCSAVVVLSTVSIISMPSIKMLMPIMPTMMVMM